LFFNQYTVFRTTKELIAKENDDFVIEIELKGATL